MTAELDVMAVALRVAAAIEATGGRYFVGGAPRLGIADLLARARSAAS